MFNSVPVQFCGLCADEHGAVAVEYGIIAMAMFGALIPAFLYVASGIQLKFSDLGSFFSG